MSINRSFKCLNPHVSCFSFLSLFSRSLFPLSSSNSLLLPLSLSVSSNQRSPSLYSTPPPLHLHHPTSLHPSFDLLPALLCWSSNHNPSPWQMEDRREKLLTSQPEPVLSAHQLLPASPPCRQNSSNCTLPPSHTHTPPPFPPSPLGTEHPPGEWCAY